MSFEEIKVDLSYLSLEKCIKMGDRLLFLCQICDFTQIPSKNI